MASGVITDSQRQVSLQLEAGLVERHRSLKDVIASGVYKRGLKAMAAELDVAPGNLSVALGDSGERKFGVDELERYIASTGDLAPIHYLVLKYIGADAGAAQAAAVRQVQELLTTLPALLASAGLPTTAKRR
jgi:hypothetical protein